MVTTRSRSGYGDKSSYTVNRIFCKLFKEREICYKTKEIFKKNLEKKRTLKKNLTLYKKRSQLGLESRTSHAPRTVNSKNTWSDNS